jgi:magnesium chelatase family protein
LASVKSATLLGVAGTEVSVEVHSAQGLPGFTMVGLPDTYCREARDRVRAAVTSAGMEWTSQRVTVNLAPSGLPKAGQGLDLAIAVGYLVATDQLAAEAVEGMGFIGELGLDGAVRGVPGTLSLVRSMTSREIVVSVHSAPEAALAVQGRSGPEVSVRAATHLRELVDVLNGDAPWEGIEPATPPARSTGAPDLRDVSGHRIPRLALEVAAAGGHHLLLIGSPGGGKTMLARRLPGLLPPLDADTTMEASCVHSAAGLALPGGGLVQDPPLRAPHHGVSQVALVGGGTGRLHPGEISLAHGGVLFLDELGEFAPVALDALRQPLEEGVIRVARAGVHAELPARFLLVAAMNPCPCGMLGASSCRCSLAARQRYQRRLSGPLVDRFDLRVEVTRPDAVALLGGEGGESTAAVAQRVVGARGYALGRGARCNSRLGAGRLDEVTELSEQARALLRGAIEQGRLSARGLQRVRSVALTMSDLAAWSVGEGVADRAARVVELDEETVSQALGLRRELFVGAAEVAS